MIEIKSVGEILKMRVGGAILAACMRGISAMAVPGVSTKDLNIAAERYIETHGGRPSFKGYNGFPAGVCTSVNEEVVHGIPGSRRLKNGDIIGIDLGICYDGYHTDMARTFMVGAVNDEARLVVDVAEASFWAGVEFAKPGCRVGDISAAIQEYAESRGCGVVRDLTGHGIGKALHEEPEVPNFGVSGKGARLKCGMALAIEPMINAGTYEVEWLDDKWTVVTKDRKPSGHYENTIIITEEGYEILTQLPKA